MRESCVGDDLEVLYVHRRRREDEEREAISVTHESPQVIVVGLGSGYQTDSKTDSTKVVHDPITDSQFPIPPPPLTRLL